MLGGLIDQRSASGLIYTLLLHAPLSEDIGFPADSAQV